MSTRSTIAILNRDGSNESIYCHFDGYPEHVGKVLLENYNTTSIVQALMRLGDLSILGPVMAPAGGSKHSYNKPIEGVTVAYRRDRGETECLAKRCESFDLLLKSFAAGDCGAVYLYIYDVTGEAWYYAECNNPMSLHKLSWKRCGVNTMPKTPKEMRKPCLGPSLDPINRHRSKAPKAPKNLAWDDSYEEEPEVKESTPKAPKAANEVVFNLKKLVYEDKVDNTQTLTELSAQLVELRDTMNVAFNNISKTLLKLK